MRILLDTLVVLWAARDDPRLSAEARTIVLDPATDVHVSAASIWEVAIKASLGRPDFTVDAELLSRRLAESGYQELAVTGAHTAAVAGLPAIHRDPNDRILVAQARAEGLTLLTSDETVARYGDSVRRI